MREFGAVGRSRDQNGGFPTSWRHAPEAPGVIDHIVGWFLHFDFLGVNRLTTTPCVLSQFRGAVNPNPDPCVFEECENLATV